MLTTAYSHQPLGIIYTHSPITRARISASLLGGTDSEQTRIRKSIARLGKNNPLYGKSLPLHVLDAAALKLGTPVYVYDQKTFTLINNIHFRSLPETAKHMPISCASLVIKLNTNKAFKGFYYFTKRQ